jgi:putative Mg2+ transporter-C (MgtC) family protein
LPVWWSVWSARATGRAAGLRTTVLACVAAALAMIISEILLLECAGSSSAWRPDPARLGAGILTGIGFLGAGTIIRHANVIRGVTTAASLWFVTVLGLAFGSGELFLGLIGLGVALVALFLLPEVERHIQSDWYATLTVTTALDTLPEDELKQRLKASGVKVKTLELNYDLVKKQKTVSCELRLKRRGRFFAVFSGMEVGPRSQSLRLSALESVYSLASTYVTASL